MPGKYAEPLPQVLDPIPATNINKCPACDCEKRQLIFHYQQVVPIERCLGCGLHYCSKRYTSEELDRFYSKDYFHGDFGYRDYDAIEPLKRKTFTDRLRRLRTFLPNEARLLDVGCANGLLVRSALREGFDAYGIDISKDIIETAQQALQSEVSKTGPNGRSGVERFFAAVPETAPFRPNSFDVLMLSDMIEHVHEPAKVIDAAQALLRPSGCLFVETPNTAGLLRMIFGTRWPLYRPPEHLVYFSPRNLHSLLEKKNFSVMEMRSSWKYVNGNYLLEKLMVTNPGLSSALRRIFRPLLSIPIQIPVGSFWCIARKVR